MAYFKLYVKQILSLATQNNMQSKQAAWRFAWDIPAFRVKLVSGLLCMAVIIFYLHDFFQFIQSRNGLILHDSILLAIPAKDVSALIFLILYPVSGYLFWKIRKNSKLCITALWGYIFLCLGRMITISLIPLNPPAGLIHLSDPFSLIFYGDNLITKDLFFSGHTATIVLIGLCLEGKREKYIVFTAAVVLGFLLLVQHIHYTADVIAAPFFSYMFWYLGKTVAKI